MKDKKTIAKKIMKYCPYDWANTLEKVITSLNHWIADEEMWNGWQTGGFEFKKTKKGRRYIEIIPIRIYVD